MYDVIVVGARCAGASTAMLLARAGRRVLLLDRLRDIGDTVSSHYVHQPGVACLDRWGLLGAIRHSGAPPIETISYESGDVRIEGAPLPSDGQQSAYAPRRFVLDPVLCRGATDAGVTLRLGCSVSGLLREGGRVCGVRGTGADGVPFTERAHVVVGADGMRSTVAGQVGATKIIEDARRTCAYYSYWPDVAVGLELFECPGRWVGALPTNQGLTLVMAYFPMSEFGTVRRDATEAFDQAVRSTAPGLHRRMTDAGQAERLYGTGAQDNFLRRAGGPGWALVGDAVHHKDSIAARGITDAFLQAEMITSYLAVDLDDHGAVDAAVEAYHADVADRFIDIYYSTLTLADLAVAEDKLSFLRAISGSQELIDRYFATLAGTLEIDDFYNADLLDVLDRQ